MALALAVTADSSAYAAGSPRAGATPVAGSPAGAPSGREGSAVHLYAGLGVSLVAMAALLAVGIRSRVHGPR
ncbi:hypothetical protein [Streptomyces uncialis]|uniref:hypothetical protein n=1 Tax=Streptomyces uncialis TaxID=1048205 RepID=UPI00386B0145|nr:hypothetical protein OG268_16450 [Streptomyces uncialis]